MASVVPIMSDIHCIICVLPIAGRWQVEDHTDWNVMSGH